MKREIPIQLSSEDSRSSETAFSVYIETYGCQMNVYDSNAMAGLLSHDGFVATRNESTADVILLNTCSVREHAEHRVVSRIGELRARRAAAGNRPAVLGVCGCMAERLGATLLNKKTGVDLVAGVDQYDRLPEMLRTLLADREPTNRAAVGHRDDLHYVAPPEAYPTNNSHLVTIHKGCDYKCTYCVVPATRGPQREKAPEVILDEIVAIVAAGGREVTLLGQNVTAYHWRERLNFAELLSEVAQMDGLERIRFLTGHPRDMDQRLMDVIGADARICPWLHVPLQSGSDRVLKRMKRLYRLVEYLAMVDYARRVIKDVTFSSDFIVGFPGETEEDFGQTLAAVRQIGFDSIFAFKYSERPDTPAARLTDDVPTTVKKQRLAALQRAQNEIWEGIAARQIGQTWQGVVENRARRPADAWRVRTANNRKVVVAAVEAVVGDSLTLRITGYSKTTFLGEVRNTAAPEVAASPRGETNC